jgi:hypothetical protein
MNAHRSFPMLLVLACASAFAAQPDAKQYTPEIHGVLMNGTQPLSSNVCLRRSGSEIRACGYTDSAGRFYIPSMGPLHSASADADTDAPAVPRSYWLETGHVAAAQKLWPIKPVNNKFSAVEIDCDVSRRHGEDREFRACDMKALAPVAANMPRDDSRYRMARPAK